MNFKLSRELSATQKRVIKLRLTGLKNKEIAVILGCKEQNVKNHMHHVYTRLDVRNLQEARIVIEDMKI